MNLIHLRIAGKKTEGASPGDLQHTPDFLCGLSGKILGSRIGQVRRHIEDGLTGIIKMRRHNQFADMVNAEPLPDVLKAPSYGQSGGSQHCGIKALKKHFFEDQRDINGSGLQDGEDLSSATPAEFAAIFNPENSFFAGMLHDEREFSLELLRAADKIQNLTGLLRQLFQL